MTFEKLAELIDKNNIPKNVALESDSGWECGPTGMDGVYYNQTKNMIVFTQGFCDISSVTLSCYRGNIPVEARKRLCYAYDIKDNCFWRI